MVSPNEPDIVSVVLSGKIYLKSAINSLGIAALNTSL